jgi:hypothetical protein
MTTAKEYLARLRNADLKIEARRLEIEQLKILATCSGSLNSDKVNVKSSKAADSMAKKVIDFVDKEAELKKDIERLIELRHQIIDMIFKLEDVRYIEVLFKRYVQYKRFEQIACEMSFSYDRARHLHIEALRAFETKLDTQ